MLYHIHFTNEYLVLIGTIYITSNKRRWNSIKLAAAILKRLPIVVMKVESEILQFVVGMYSQGRYTLHITYIYLQLFSPHQNPFQMVVVLLVCFFASFFHRFLCYNFFLLQFHFFIFLFIAAYHCCWPPTLLLSLCRSRRCCLRHYHCCRQPSTSHWQFSCPVLPAIKAKQNA